MTVLGLETVSYEVASEGYFIKCIVNSSTAIFFPGSVQHRDAKQNGISYEDDYRGNAMAATIRPGIIEIRFHRGFSDESVQLIFSNLLRIPEMAWASEFSVSYQGRCLRMG